MAHPARNFRLDDETWDAFKAACEGEGSKAAIELTRFVRAYIAGHRVDRAVDPDGADPTTSQRLDALERKVSNLSAIVAGKG
jgi:hypothetical protein